MTSDLVAVRYPLGWYMSTTPTPANVPKWQASYFYKHIVEDGSSFAVLTSLARRYCHVFSSLNNWMLMPRIITRSDPAILMAAK